MSKCEKVPVDLMKKVVFGPGIVLSEFSPESGTIDAGSILFETKGTNSFKAERELKDMGADFNNVPEGTKQLQRAKKYKAMLSGTGVSATKESIAKMVGSADASTGSGFDKITPRENINLTDFADLWFLVNYSEYNGETNGGWMAIHLMNAYNVDGFSAAFNKEENGEFPFNFQAFYDLDHMETVPFEIYLKAGTAEGKGV